MKTLTQFINERKAASNYQEIKHFHPDGLSEPNGCGIHRGGYFYECKNNFNSFIINEGVHPEQYGLKKYRGGIIVFATSINAIKLDNNKFINKLKQSIRTFIQDHQKDKIIAKIIDKINKSSDTDYIGAYSIGNAFKGKYISDSGVHFNDKSYTIEINGLSSKGLMLLAQYICRIFKQETVLVKDFNQNKIFLANGFASKEDDYSEINTKSI